MRAGSSDPREPGLVRGQATGVGSLEKRQPSVRDARTLNRHHVVGVNTMLAMLAMLVAIAACTRAPATRVIVMSGTRFQPVVDTVQAGDTVVWKNDDLVSHTAAADDSTFSSGNLDVGQVWRTNARTVGTHPYRCLYHTGMQGTLVVR